VRKQALKPSSSLPYNYAVFPNEYSTVVKLGDLLAMTSGMHGEGGNPGRITSTRPPRQIRLNRARKQAFSKIVL
jgi:hypothetical protein